MLIHGLIITPLLGSLILLIDISRLFYTKNNKISIEKTNWGIALIISIITFLVSMVLLILFQEDTILYQFVPNFLSNIYLSNIYFFNQSQDLSFYLGIDGLSIFYVLLTTIITPICILSSWRDITNNYKLFFICFLILEVLQILVFIVTDLLLFYVFFESVLIPLFLIIGIWGSSEEKIRASYLLFLYTLGGSLFMLLAILYIYYNYGTTDLQIISFYEISKINQLILFIGFFISFAVKTPLVPFHLWLFRAHAEAPLAGSIILAAVILKLATYGFLRIIIPILPEATSYYLYFIQSLCIITLIYSSLVTIRQNDLKALVAYSSVAHMAVVILGLFSNTLEGIEGAITLSLAHGFVSPALFICVGGIMYTRYHNRDRNYYRGLVKIMPLFTILFYIFCIFNAAVPLSLNWIGEFLALAGTFQNAPITAGLGASGILLSACYSIWMFNRISFGSFSHNLTPTKDITNREFHLLLPLLFLTLILGLTPNIILECLHMSVSNILY